MAASARDKLAEGATSISRADKSLLSRRDFCGLAGGLVAATAVRPLFAFSPEKQAAVTVDVARLDRTRILSAAQRYLRESPITITASSSSRSAGGNHDYFSEADYFWPDPANPGGPYINRDGMSNPDNFNDHRHALIRLSIQVAALAAAWLLTKDEKYAAHAARHLRAWFLDEATLMNPNLEFAQAIHGRSTGRGIGIIDTLHLVEVTRAVSFLAASKSLTQSELQGVTSWFAKYLEWMTTSQHGHDERDTKNNHSTCWVAQVAEFSRLTGNHALMDDCRTRFKTVLVPNQIAADGSFPQELRRTKPYGYCLFNLDAMATVCQILSSREDNLWTFELADGRGIGKAVAYMFPFIADKKTWPLPPDVQYFDDWPVRQPSLLFAGVGLSRPEYIKLWSRLNPDPTVAEIIRNFPIRQPVLWMSSPVATRP